MEKVLIEEIKNYLKVTDDISSAGQPGKDDLSPISDYGFAAVINLGLDDVDYSLKNEREYIESLGMDYIHIPVAFDNPTHEDYQIFKKAMNRFKNAKVFVHCAANMRVSVFLAIYLMQEYDWSEPEAIKMIEKIWHPNKCWRGFFKAEKQRV